MLAWVVMNRHQPRQARRSCLSRVLPVPAHLFQRSNVRTFRPSNIPLSELTSLSSPKKSSLSFHALTWNPFCIPFVFKFMHGMGGGYPLSTTKGSTHEHHNR